MPGFVAIENFVFDRSKTLVDPTEEKIRAEFKDVRSTFIPIYSIVRIDEVERGGALKIHRISGQQSTNISPLISMPLIPDNDDSEDSQ